MDLMTLLERYGLATVTVLYLLIRFIPQMFAAFRAELAEERRRADARDAAAALEREKDRQMYSQHVAEERQQCQANHVLQMEAHQDTRHAVNELANMAGLKRAIADAQKKAGE